MKKLFLSLIIAFISISSFAQPLHYKLSLVAGPDISWMKSDKRIVNSEGDRLGYTFGLMADIFLPESPRYSFSTGILINSQGGKLSYRTSDPFTFSDQVLQPGTTITYKLQYLEIPTVIKLRTAQFYRTTYFGQFGLTNKINIGANGSTSDGKFSDEGINNEISLFNSALNIGGGIEYDLGKNNALSVGLIYNDGIIDITTNNVVHDRTKLNAIRLQIGIIF
ncbi:MAG: porin family protein [Bacteroidota bacterium]|nr:porin family protein [Bacteroidota bacterium]MDP4204546.1 porin family protein [Bacteroidota bacterium]